MGDYIRRWRSYAWEWRVAAGRPRYYLFGKRSRFQNWMNNHSAKVTHHFPGRTGRWQILKTIVLEHLGRRPARDPSTEDRLKELERQVGVVLRRRDKIRAAGRGFSWSRLVPPKGVAQATKTTGGTVLSMYGMNRVLAIGSRLIDGQHQPVVTVEAGISLGRLNRILAKYGLTLRSPTIFPYVSVGGALSTGSHGTGRDLSTFSDQVVDMVVVDGTGRRREISPTNNADCFPAAICGLGCFGVIYSVTLRCRQNTNVYVESRALLLSRLLGAPDLAFVKTELHGFIRDYQFLEFYWHPGSPVVHVIAMHDTDEPVPWRNPILEILRFWLEFLLQLPMTLLLIVATKFLRSTLPVFMRWATWVALPPRSAVVEARDAFQYLTFYPKSWSLEYGIPVEKATEALRCIVSLVRDFRIYKDEYPVDLLVHLRFVKASKGYLTGAYARDSCQIEIASSAQARIGNKECVSADLDSRARHPIERSDLSFYELFDVEMRKLGGRPHWGKLLVQPEKIRESFPEKAWSEFQRCRKKCDPDDIFFSEFLRDKVFYESQEHEE